MAAIAIVAMWGCSGDDSGSSDAIGSTSSDAAAVTTVVPATSTLPPWEVGLDPSGGVDGPMPYGAKPTEPIDGYPAALIAGELRLDDGCLTIGGNPVLWPYGLHWQADPPGIVYPNGSVQLVGTAVDTGGAYYGGSIRDLTSVPATIELVERCLLRSDGEIVLPNPPVVVADG